MSTLPRALVRFLLATLLIVPWSGARAAEAQPLVFGLFPNLSPRTLVTMYQPMRDFLEAELERPVELVTANNFTVFTQRMLAGEYDLMVAAPHLARLGQLDAGYRLLAHYTQPLQACVVVASGSDLRELRDLKGKRIAVPDRLAVMTSLGIAMLEQAGLQNGQHYQMFEAKSHNSAAFNVANGRADAAVIGSIPLEQLSGEIRDRLRVVARSQAIPSQYFAVSGKLSSQERMRIERALFKFARTTGGKHFLAQYGLLGLAKAGQGELKGMDAHARQAKQALTEPAGP